MMQITARSRRMHGGLIAGLLGAMAMALTGCQLREEGNEPEPVESGSPTPIASGTQTPSPEPSATETRGASIIRQEASADDEFEIPVPPYSGTIPFPEGGADLSPSAVTALEGVLASDAMSEGWPIILRGHSDSDGNDQANMRVSRARAEAVAAWLVERGVDDSRIRVIAFGEQNPLAPNALPNGNANEPGRRQNRRVEVEIAAPASGGGTTRVRQG